LIVVRRGELTDKAWARIEPLLPVTDGRGHPWRDHREVIDGILWRLRTGAPWRDVPERYGPWQTCHERFKRWEEEGTWARLLQDGNRRIWSSNTATKNSIRWKPHRGRAGHLAIHIDFDPRRCTPCPVRATCTRSATAARAMTLSTRAEHEAIRRARQAQSTPQWERHYATRAGGEAVIAQGLRRCGLRRSRYIGQDKTHLQHVLTAAAINLIRIDAWLADIPLAKTRVSPFARLRPP
jgi:transposase